MKQHSFRRPLDRLVGLVEEPETSPREGGASVDTLAFRNAMAGAVNGVAIVTTDGPGGRAGITVSSAVSASLTPPLVIVCIRRQTRALAAITRNRTFCVNLLGMHHRQLADVFAGRPEAGAPYDFSRASWIRGVTGSPVLPDAVAGFDCVLDGMHRAGTHEIVLGRCVGVRQADGPALLYTRRSYGIPFAWAPVAAPGRRSHDLRTGEYVS